MNEMNFNVFWGGYLKKIKTETNNFFYIFTGQTKDSTCSETRQWKTKKNMAFYPTKNYLHKQLKILDKFSS